MNTEQALEQLFGLSEVADKARVRMWKRLDALEADLKKIFQRLDELDASSHVHEYVDLAEHPEVEDEDLQPNEEKPE